MSVSIRDLTACNISSDKIKLKKSFVGTKFFLPLSVKNKEEALSPKNELTKGELEILQVLWEYGPSTVRQVNERINDIREVNYTSTLKLMQIMAEKNILKRDESQMKHVYHVIEEERKTKSHLLDNFVKTLYQGSAGELIMHLLGDDKTSDEELKAIKGILNKLEKDKEQSL